MARTQRITADWLARGGLRDLGLSTHEGWVLLALVSRANKDGIAWPSQLRISADLGIARSTVQDALGRLREVGAVEEHEPGRIGRSTRWRIGEVPLQPAREAGRFEGVNLPVSRGRLAS